MPYIKDEDDAGDGLPPRKRINLAIVPADESTVSEDIDEDTVQTRSGPKLKGTVYPGMGVFDAATDEMKKNRNQRKSASLTAQLKANSDAVQPIEMVFDMNLQLQRVRNVFDRPSPPPSPVSIVVPPTPELPFRNLTFFSSLPRREPRTRWSRTRRTLPRTLIRRTRTLTKMILLLEEISLIVSKGAQFSPLTSVTQSTVLHPWP